MRKIQLTLFFAALLLLNACKKTEYSNTSTTTQPVFYFNGFINSTPVNIQAGVNNYYMSTSYSKDTKGVYNYIGEFTTTGHPSTYPNSLEISFKDFSQKPSSDPKHIDTVITPGYYSYSTATDLVGAYSVQFQGYFNQTAISYYWDFGDGQTLSGTANKPVHVYSRPGIYTVSMKATSTSSCYSLDTNETPVGQVGNAFIAPFSNGGWAVTSHGDSTAFSAVAMGGMPPYTYTWDFGDPYSGTNNTYTGFGSSIGGSHTFSIPGVYLVSITTTDATGYTDKQTANIATPTASGCAAGFFRSSETPISNPNNLGDVIIQWYDNTSTLWSSENDKQSIKSMLQVISVADYMNNSAGQATKIITAKINCKLYSAGNDSIPISGNVVFSIAHF